VVSDQSLVSYLGPNTVPIARQLADRLGAHLGSRLDHVAPSSWREVEDAIDTGSGWLFWLCGLATVELIDDGRFDGEIVAAPVFPGESGPVYRSVLIGRGDGAIRSIDDVHDASLAINATSSWSGYHALRAHFAERGRFDGGFATIVVTGGHLASITAVVDGDADCAAIDSSIWADQVQQDPRLQDLQIVAVTDDRPAPPFSVSRAVAPDLRREMVASLTGGPPSGLQAIVPATSADYDPIRRGMAAAARVAW
jgi:ABC-type phosphate/phosphonate transport system substrate-binding protein